MKLGRVSIATLCVAVAVVAVDCAWLRHADRTNKSLLGFRGPALDAAVVPMATLLIVGAAHVLIDRGRPYRASAGPLIGGLAGLSLYLAYNYALVHLDRRGSGNFANLSMRPMYYARETWPVLDFGTYLYWADAVYYTPPQLLVAAAVAALIRRWRRAPVPATDPGVLAEEIR